MAPQFVEVIFCEKIGGKKETLKINPHECLIIRSHTPRDWYYFLSSCRLISIGEKVPEGIYASTWNDEKLVL